MSYNYHVRKTNPSYGTGFFNHKQQELYDLLVDLDVEVYTTSQTGDDISVIEVDIPSFKDAIVKLKTDAEKEPDKLFLGNSREDGGYTVIDLIACFETWLNEIEHTEDYFVLEAF